MSTHQTGHKEMMCVSGGLHKRHSSSCGTLAIKSEQQTGKENSETGSRVGTARAKSVSECAGKGSALPFGDRTNTVESRVKSSSSGEKIGSLKELAPPLNVARLRPIRQQTRSATVSELRPVLKEIQFVLILSRAYPR